MVAYVLVIFLNWELSFIQLNFWKSQGPKVRVAFLQRGFALKSKGRSGIQLTDQGSLKLFLQNQAQSRNLRCNAHTLQCASKLVLGWY